MVTAMRYALSTYLLLLATLVLIWSCDSEQWRNQQEVVSWFIQLNVDLSHATIFHNILVL